MINLENLKLCYGDFVAVDNLSLTIPEGEILGLLGPNGAGKSTTMRMLTNYLSPTEGRILIKGKDIHHEPLEAKNLIGYLPESSPLYSDMLVYDYLLFIANIRGLLPEEAERRIDELSYICGIRDIMYKNVYQLSKGYKQRVGLAMAMMSDPEILVLDEPTSGLDPNQIIEIRSIMKELGREKTIILSTHILSEVEATCDRVVIINNGKIVADGNIEALKREAQGEITLKLAVKGPKEKEVATELKKVEGTHSISFGQAEGGVVASISSSNDLRKEIYDIVRSLEWQLLEFTQTHHSLEDIFRQLTGKEGQNE